MATTRPTANAKPVALAGLTWARFFRAVGASLCLWGLLALIAYAFYTWA